VGSITPWPTKIPECDEGFLVVYATQATPGANFGAPIAYNNLIGSYRITYPDGRAEAANAIAFQSNPGVAEGTVLTGDPVTGGLRFGPLLAGDYTPLPIVLYTDFQAPAPDTLADPVTQNDTVLYLLDLNIISNATNPIAAVSIKAYNEWEALLSAGTEFMCWQKKELEDINKNFDSDKFGSKYGSMVITSKKTTAHTAGLLGAIHESSPGPTLRNLLHGVPLSSGVVYVPD
jgi:hypothetical protein